MHNTHSIFSSQETQDSLNFTFRMDSNNVNNLSNLKVQDNKNEKLNTLMKKIYNSNS